MTRTGNREPAEPALFELDSITGDGKKKIADRYYQVDAVHEIGLGLRTGGRGQLRSACGTGKTVMSQRSAELLCPRGGLVVIVCPSIALVSQTLREWAATNFDHVALAVCGDDTVSDAVITTEDLPATVTTDPVAVADWLRTRSTAGLRLIVGTHRSAHVIGEALLAADTVAELLIVDEAHRSAGGADKHTALVHDDEHLPATRRLYTTATPRILNPKARYAKKMIGMDDVRIFGRVLYDYPFSRAIEDGYLDDYRLVVMGVTRQEIREYLAGLPRTAITGRSSTGLHTAMVQTVLAKAAAQYGMRRVLAFCRRLNEAADFARSMARTLSALPDSMKPDRRLTTAFVHGGMSTTEREQQLDLLVNPPDDGWTVITNVHCLAEGVDVPAIDGVVFTHPKQSTSEIVQAIGRALRRDPQGTGTATILVPILLPEDPGDVDELDVADYWLLWQVVSALRAHDDKLGATIDRAGVSRTGARYDYEERPLEHVLVELPPGYDDDGTFLHHLTAQMISAARHPWWDAYAALHRFNDEFGHVTVKGDYVVAPGTPQAFKLGAWTENARTAYRQGRLAADRVEALRELGFDFRPDAVEWAAGVRAAIAFHTENGHLEPVRSLRVRNVELRAWLDKQRARAAAGDLADSRRGELDALGMRWHEQPGTFDEHLTALTGYHGRHGDIDIAPDPATADGRLGSWLVSARMDRRRGRLTEEQVGQLDALGMRWSSSRPAPTVAQAAAPAG